MLNVEMQTYTYIGSTIVQIYCTILADIVRHRHHLISSTNRECAPLSQSIQYTSKESSKHKDFNLTTFSRHSSTEKCKISILPLGFKISSFSNNNLPKKSPEVKPVSFGSHLAPILFHKALELTPES